MRRKLQLHPDSRCAAVSGIEVEAERIAENTLGLRYFVSGEIGNMRLPPVATAMREDDLWRHTCFEAFLCVPPDAGYCEMNFAPSTCWAAYHFENYRNGRCNLDIRAPRIDVRSGTAQLELCAVVRMNDETNLSVGAVWNLGLAAVIEETNGYLSYWALAHSSGRPDFHRSENYVLELAPQAGARE